MPTTDQPTPAHQRLVDELLAWDQPRPVVDPTLRDRLHTRLMEGLAPVVDQVPAGQRLFLGKTSLASLVCDGRYLDQESSNFEWSPQLAGGKLAHRAIELDLAGRRQEDVEAIVASAWREFASDDSSIASWLNQLDTVAASALRHTALQRLTDFRDTWPLLPAAAHLRLEQRIEATAGDGAIIIRGTPDIVLGGVRDDRARMLLVDLKTGMRSPAMERQDMRLYALLATLKYGLPPFRWATYYVSEGAWDAEDFAEELLTGAVNRVVDAANRAVVLRWSPPPEAELRLVGGAWCRFCGRRGDCPAASIEDPDGA